MRMMRKRSITMVFLYHTNFILLNQSKWLSNLLSIRFTSGKQMTQAMGSWLQYAYQIIFSSRIGFICLKVSTIVSISIGVKFSKSVQASLYISWKSFANWLKCVLSICLNVYFGLLITRSAILANRSGIGTVASNKFVYCS